MKRRNPKPLKNTALTIAMTHEELGTISMAAGLEDMPTSSWLRREGLRRATQRLEEAE